MELSSDTSELILIVLWNELVLERPIGNLEEQLMILRFEVARSIIVVSSLVLNYCYLVATD